MCVCVCVCVCVCGGGGGGGGGRTRRCRRGASRRSWPAPMFLCRRRRRAGGPISLGRPSGRSVILSTCGEIARERCCNFAPPPPACAAPARPRATSFAAPREPRLGQLRRRPDRAIRRSAHWPAGLGSVMCRLARPELGPGPGPRPWPFPQGRDRIRSGCLAGRHMAACAPLASGPGHRRRRQGPA